MESDHNSQLERAINRALHGLPDLPAPECLVATVMAAIRERSALPWYRRSWPVWPTGVQFASLAVMLALFGGICFAGWKLAQADSMANAMEKAGEWFSTAGLIWTTLGALGNAMLVFLKELNPAFVVAGIAISVFSYAMCIGLGTVFFRYARHQ